MTANTPLRSHRSFAPQRGLPRAGIRPDGDKANRGGSESLDDAPAASSPPFSLPSEVTQTHVLSSSLGQTRPRFGARQVANRPVLGRNKEEEKKARPPGDGGLCMIKVTSKIGSHKRGQSFAIIRPDSCGVSHSEAFRLSSASAAGSTGSSTGLAFSTARKHIRYARPRVGWVWAALGRGGGEGRRGGGGAADAGAGAGAAGNRDLVVVAVATHPESCCCCRCSACGQLMTGVWCVSTDVILRCQ